MITPTTEKTLERLPLPAEVEAVFEDFLTCEFTTIGKAGVPITWPTLPVYWPEGRQFVIASPVALANKAFNVRRNPRVALLFSHPAGSGLLQPPAVLVQGDAYSPPEVMLSTKQFEPSLLAAMSAQGRKMLRLQPGMRMYLANRLTRYIMEWYFIRVMIYIKPRRIMWWQQGDFSRPPSPLEV